MRKYLFRMVFILIFLVGLSVLLYPFVSDYINSLTRSGLVYDYFKSIENFSEQDYYELFEAAHEYNRRLRFKPNRYKFSDEDRAEYYSLLNPNRNRMMGVLEIESVQVSNMPIFHGTDEGYLQRGSGHFEGTSLPVGGPSTHSMITAHTGLPSATLFTRLDRMLEGDTFVLRILNEILTYRVDRIVIVEPHEVDLLDIVPNMDYCTLSTCTPYGINSHRLLVRGYRIDNILADITPREMLVVIDEGIRVDSIQIALILLSPLFIILPVYLFIKYRTIYGRRNRL